LIAKSSVLFDVKPWDDETDLAKMEASVRSIIMDGLVWGAGWFYFHIFFASLTTCAAKLVPVGYGIKKLQILAIVEDDKVSTEELSEKIAEDFEDFVS
jgi:translation elongation factor EF-1beta